MSTEPPGSSPLARGLPRARVDRVQRGGIIPARAGFTPRSPTPTGPAGDHPRSRGVYCPSPGALCPAPGSSPLARGLPFRRPPPGRRGRIIPARAGFTAMREGLIAVDPDHPRSRGVYARGEVIHPLLRGSSPLARGLLRRVTPIISVDRIIPARAGFTSRRCRPGRGGRDHPRSRGVYWWGPGAVRGPRGSSPLARGLRDGAGGVGAGARIIPARAGFTSSAKLLSTCAKGSSPLARGLPGPHHVGLPRRRIIPARAGFTPAPGYRLGHCRDHPRSRGVYDSHGEERTSVRGSSPLARGLPIMRLLMRLPIKDHPRSRGVYRWWDGGGHIEYGSSPLARGLPSNNGQAQHFQGIIPARAGFTRILVHEFVRQEDHPRSRGVYVHGRQDHGLGQWIIPARAGFTRACGRRTARRRDHPRSRGVYTCGSLESQRTCTLPDPGCLHCRPRARSAELR